MKTPIVRLVFDVRLNGIQQLEIYQMISQILSRINGFVEGFDTNDYLMLAACAVLIGFMCLRGFGSRSNY